MAGFFGKVKEGASKAAFEADRLARQTRAQGALNSLQRQLEAQLTAMGKQALAIYDAGTLTQPELVAFCQQLGDLRQQITNQEAEVERIRQEKPPAPAGAAAPTPAPVGPRAAAPVASPTAQAASTVACPNCGATIPAGAAFCPECGTRLTPAA